MVFSLLMMVCMCVFVGLVCSIGESVFVCCLFSVSVLLSEVGINGIRLNMLLMVKMVCIGKVFVCVVMKVVRWLFVECFISEI